MGESRTPGGPVTLCVLLWARPGAEGGLTEVIDVRLVGGDPGG
jgi:hypothetical protein